ncbi:S9 family peptidase [Microbacterium sp. VKM Ac-2870]|uniref:S9 family peptidase n=1 Tax=Microbacterium sp. VKM Ac-2870 TaxID=2783825 RepID=UPI00188DB463|nr:S9 family peptidase [Microbacterium sp. VKM Ac-2870]MBF4560983.1 S9 family peptidase [Microbacterium sp. VKM Ac-2870]
MRPEDITALVSVGRPHIAPDGSFAVFATSRPDLAADRNVGQIWRVDLPDGQPRRLTRGVSDAHATVSPDGGRVAFVRSDDDGVAQIFVIPASGGEPVQATASRGGVGDYAWSPDGTRLAFTARVPEQGRYGTVEGRGAEAESPRRITGIRWHANGLGYIGDRPAHLFIIDAPDMDAEPFYTPAPSAAADGTSPTPKMTRVAADAVALTSGAASHHGVVFTADGAHLITVVDEIERDRRDLRTPLRAIAVDGSGSFEVLGREAGLSVDDVAVAGDGTVAVLASNPGPSGMDFIAPDVALYVLDGALTAGTPRRLTDPERLDLGEVGSHITPIGDDFLVQNRCRGRVELLRVTRAGEVATLVDGDVEVGGHAAAAERIVYSLATPTSLGELALVGEGRLTSFSAAVADKSVLVLPEEREITARDGYPVHGWIAVPPGEGPFPVILQIHGGPYASYGIHLFDETQVLVDAGYAVVYCNPRGSAGYGREHGRSIRGAMGTLDLVDVIDFLDAAIESDPRLDGARVGIQGGSYGGYLTAWTIAHDHRFAAAIVERGFLDPVSFQGTSDIGSFFGDEYVGTAAEDMARQSPMAVVDAVRTPTLVLHSELDYRCPLEQATRYYSALKRQGTEAEMLIFPGENHELTRSGRPRHRVERFEAVLEWWARYLPIR